MLAPIKAIMQAVETIVQGIDSIVSFFADFFKNLFDKLLDFVKNIFVPSDSYWDSQIGNLQKSLESKLGTKGYEQLMDTLDNPISNGAPNVSMTVLGVTVDILDLSIITDNIKYIHMFIYAIFGIILLRYNINNVHKIISGGQDLYKGGDDL